MSSTSCHIAYVTHITIPYLRTVSSPSVSTFRSSPSVLKHAESFAHYMSWKHLPWERTLKIWYNIDITRHTVGFTCIFKHFFTIRTKVFQSRQIGRSKKEWLVSVCGRIIFLSRIKIYSLLFPPKKILSRQGESRALYTYFRSQTRLRELFVATSNLRGHYVRYKVLFRAEF